MKLLGDPPAIKSNTGFQAFMRAFAAWLTLKSRRFARGGSRRPGPPSLPSPPLPGPPSPSGLRGVGGANAERRCSPGGRSRWPQLSPQQSGWRVALFGGHFRPCGSRRDGGRVRRLRLGLPRALTFKAQQSLRRREWDGGQRWKFDSARDGGGGDGRPPTNRFATSGPSEHGLTVDFQFASFPVS